MTRPNRAAFGALLAGNVCLAFGPWFVRLADVGPVAAAFWRLALALPLLVLFAAIWRQPGERAGRGTLLALALGGLFFAVDLAAWHGGILMTKLANATLLGNTAALFYPLYGFVVARAWPGRTQSAALVLALAGAGLLLGRSAELSRATVVGDLLCLTAGVTYTVYLATVERARGRLSSWTVLALATTASAPPLLAFALALGEPILPGNWTPLILLALASQVAGQGLVVFAIRHLSPLVVGLVFLIQPVIGTAIGWWAYGEALAPLDLVGAAGIAAALVLVRLGR